MHHQRGTKQAQEIGVSNLTRKVSKDQKERDLTLLERYELHQEKVNHQETLNLVVNPNVLTYGNSHFLWSLRNTHSTEL